MNPLLVAKLPNDLLLQILDYIPRPTDLKALCLTCSRLREVATPRLYYKVSLRDDPSATQANNNFLQKDHPGHRYVRSLEIVRPHMMEKHEKSCTGFQHPLVDEVLKMLTPDFLYEFSAPTVPLSDRAAATLCAKQRNLRSVAFGPMTSNVARMLRENHIEEGWLDSLVRLRVPHEFANRTEADFYYDIPRRNMYLPVGPYESEISSVVIHTSYMDGKSPNVQLDADERDGGCEGIFAFPRFSDLRNLTSLEFHEVDLGHNPERLNFSEITSLKLIYCGYSNGVLEFVRAPLLRKLHLVTEPRETIDPDPLEEFFERSECLEELYIRTGFEKGSDFRFDSLSGHRSTLQKLAISFKLYEDENPLEPLMSPNYLIEPGDLKFPVTHLGLALPRIDILGGSDLALQRYHETINELVKYAKGLQVLRIFNFPNSRDNSIRIREEDYEYVVPTPFQQDAYLCRLDDIATRIFQDVDNHVKGNKLSLLCFGQPGERMIHDEVYDEGLLMPPLCYFRGRQIDMFGIVRPLALRKTVAEARYIKPNDFLLQL